MKALFVVILMLTMISCEFYKFYKIDDSSYTLLPDLPKLYSKNTNAIGLQVRGYDKGCGIFYIILSITNNRPDTVIMDTKEGKLWCAEGGAQILLLGQKGGRKIGEQIVTILPQKKASLVFRRQISECADGILVDTVYAFPGVIRTSSGFEMALDTLRFILPADGRDL